MEGGKGVGQTFSAGLKDVVTALRDSVVFLLFVLLLLTPETIRARLEAAGFKRGSIGGLEWEAEVKAAVQETKAVGEKIETAQDNYDEIVHRLGELEARVTDPQLRADVRALEASAKSSATELSAANRAVRSSLVAQQALVSKVDPGSSERAGWIYLGKVDEQKTGWTSGSPETVTAARGLPVQGSMLSVVDDVYLRADGDALQRSSAPILGAIKRGAQVEVLELDYSHARGGGWFVWAKVRAS